MKYLLLPLLILLNGQLAAQGREDSVRKICRWEVNAGSGVFVDLYYANIFIVPGTRSRFNNYSDQRKKIFFFGKADKLEIMRRFKSQRSAVSLAFQNVLVKAEYGSGNDPLERWKRTKRLIHKIQFYGNYYRVITPNTNTELKIGLGFMVQGEKNGNPFYKMDVNGIAEIGAFGNFYWWDPCLPLTVHYMYKHSKTVSIGASFYSYYVWQIGVEGAAIQATVALNF
jgi:hypothetical protein